MKLSRPKNASSKVCHRFQSAMIFRWVQIKWPDLKNLSPAMWHFMDPPFLFIPWTVKFCWCVTRQITNQLGAIGGILRNFHDTVSLGIQSKDTALYTPYYRIANYFDLAQEMKVCCRCYLTPVAACGDCSRLWWGIFPILLKVHIG